MKKVANTCSIAVIVLLATTKLVGDEPKKLRTSSYFLVDVIGHFEGCYSTPYIDPVGVKTVGIGHSNYCKDIHKNKYSNHELARFFAQDVYSAEQCVNRNFNGEKMPQGAFNAMTSFVFNVGCASAKGLKSSTKIRNFALQGNYHKMCDSLNQWVYGTVNGKKTVLKGLVERRMKEREECYKGL